jgi:putative heme utilization carrier protein HutX
MSDIAEKTDDRRARAIAALAEKPEGMVEMVATAADVTPVEILEILPEGSVVFAGAEKFDEVWNELRTWGEVLIIVQTADIVLEVAGSLPEGTESHGWFNIHGDSPIGGHIKKDNCTSIAVVDRNTSRRVCSVWFNNADGKPMFKIFVRRDENKQLKADQLAKFEALGKRLKG